MIPFVPPAHWVQMPQGAIGSRVVDNWARPAGKEQFSVIVMPFPGTAAMLAAASSKAKIPGVTELSNTPVNLCGNSARLETRSAASSLIEQETVTRDGYAFLLMYSRPKSSPADAAIRQTLRGFCPGAGGTVPPLTPPPGWTARGSYAMDGMWMGNRPMQMMMLMEGPHQQRLIDAAKRGLQNKSLESNKLMTTSSKPLTLCGLPAIEVTASFKDPQMPMESTAVVTQNATTSYVLTYMHPGSTSADPAAAAALLTLCAAPSTQPSPSVSPPAMPSASAVPSSTP